MRKIILYGPAVDRLGRFRDAGSELTVGGADNDKADISAAAAQALIDSGRAVTWTDAKQAEATAEGATMADPLDHDGDGRKGGVAAAKSAA